MSREGKKHLPKNQQHSGFQLQVAGSFSRPECTLCFRRDATSQDP